jgi:hypothetical protein
MFPKGRRELSRAGQEILDRPIERKYMSTKTITKRVALATVVALGAGVLSLVTVSSASADANVAPGLAGPTASVTALNIGTAGNASGSAVNKFDTSIAISSAAASSVGLVAVGDLSGAGTRVAGTTQTAILLSNGSLVVYTDSTAVSGGTITVEGGTVGSGVNTSAINGSQTVAAYAHGAGYVSVVITPSSGAKTMTVRGYNQLAAGTGADGSTSNPTSGTLFGQISVTIASSATNGVISVANSGIYYKANGTAQTSSTVTSDDTTTTVYNNYKSGSKLPWNKTNFAIIRAVDAYGMAVSSNTGLLTATATNGAYVNLASGTNVVAAGTQSTAFVANTQPDGNTLAVSAPSAAPLSTVVTVAFNGVTIGTKSFTFTGPITKVTLGAQNKITLNGSTASTGDGVKAATISFADAAGNTIYPVLNDTAYPTSGFAASSSATVGSLVLSVTPTSSLTGYVNFNAASDAATKSATAIYTNIDGSVATSNTVNLSNAGTGVSYTASYDKNTYTPGAIATLSVTFKDSKGNLAADNPTTLYFSQYEATARPLLSVAGGTLAAAPSTTTATSNGVATFTVLTGVEGSYQTAVNLGTVSGLTQTTPATAGFSVSSGSTSLNDVLKGIVSLIASINKQIAALAKLVTKKK